MSNVPTLEEELSDAKDSLKNEILKDYDEVDYSEDNYQKIVDKIDDALKELDNVDEVNNFDDSNLKDELDKVPTILDEAKQDALNQLKDAYESYEENDYSNDNWSELKSAYEGAKVAIEQSTSTEEINDNLNNGIEEMSNVPTLEEELSDAKDSLKNEILKDYDENDYSEENYQEILDKVDDALKELDNVDEVNNFDDSNLKDELDKVPTILDEAKQDALTQLKDAYESYNENDYSNDNWSELKSAYEDAKVAIEQSTSTEEINDNLNNGIEEMSNVPTLLDEAKQVALAQLKDAYESYNENDYSNDNWSELNAAYEGAKVAIEQSTSTEEINDNLNNGIEEMSNVPTLEEELNEAKDSLKNEILKDYDEVDYSEDNYQKIVDKIDDALKELDNVDEVNNFDDSNLKDELDKVPTILDEAKQDALNQLKDAYESYEENDYSNDNWSELKSAYEGAKVAIEQSTSTEEINDNLNNGIEEMSNVPTLLDEAKQDALNQLKDAYESYEENDYSEENWSVLTDAYTSSKEAIEESSTVEDVNINLNIGIEEMSNVPTLEEELSDAKDSLKNEILKDYDENDYSEENYQEILDKVDDALKELDNVDEVNNFDDSNLKDELDKVPTILDEAKQDALTQLKDAYESYNENDYSNDNWSELKSAYEDAKVAIEQSTSTEEINDNLNNGIEEMSNVPTLLDEAKQVALAQLKDAYESYNENDYSNDNWSELNAAYEGAKVAIEQSTSTEEINDNLNNGIEEMSNVPTLEEELNEAKDSLKNEILKDYDEVDYSEDNYQKIVDKIDDALKELDNVDEVNNFDDSNLKDELDKVPTILDEAKQDALNQLKDAYESYEENDYSNDNWSELKSAYEGAKVAIEQSTSTEEINDNLNNGIEEMSNVPTLLDEAKQDALNQLKDAYESYEENDYSEENWSVLTDAYTSSKEAIEESSTVEDVNINLNIGIEEMSNVPTLEEELSDAKDSLKNEILKDYDENDYSEENYQEILDKVDDALKELDNVDEVNNFDDSNLKDELDKVPTILDEAKQDALTQLKDAYESYNENDYSNDNWSELKSAYEDAKVAIEQSTSTEEINDNLNNGIEEMSNVPTLLDEVNQVELAQ